MSVKIIVDSAADFLPETAARVKCVDMVVRFGDKEYIDGVELSTYDFYGLLTTSEDLPTTSQITPYTYETVFEEVLKEYDEAVCITLSSGLSGTYQSALIAAENFPGKIYVVDSLNATIGIGVLAEAALNLVDMGMTAGEIAQRLDVLRTKVRVMGAIDTLEYLKRGGRISPTVAFAGGLLNIKPVIKVTDVGTLELAGKARGTKASHAMLSKLIREEGEIDFSMPLLLAYSGQDGAVLDTYLEANGDLWAPYGKELPRTVVGSIVGTHIGPGGVAVAYFLKD